MNLASPAAVSSPIAPAAPAAPSTSPGTSESGEPFAQALQQARGGRPDAADARPAQATPQRPGQKEGPRATTPRETAQAESRRTTARADTQGGGDADADVEAGAAVDSADRAEPADATLRPTDLPAWLQALAPALRPSETVARQAPPAGDLPPDEVEAAGTVRPTTRPAVPGAGPGGPTDRLAAGHPEPGWPTAVGRDAPSDAATPSLATLQGEPGGERFRDVLQAAAPADAMAPAGLSASTQAGAPGAPVGDAAAPAALPEREIRTPLHAPGFAPALGAQLTLLVKEGVTEARLHLNPAEMGPIAVQIQLDGAQARVEMVAEHAATRQVLEQSMPSLASALRESGLTLSGGGVFDQASRQPQRGDAEAARQAGGTPSPGADGGVGAEPGVATRPLAAPRGMVDVYA